MIVRNVMVFPKTMQDRKNMSAFPQTMKHDGILF